MLLVRGEFCTKGLFLQTPRFPEQPLDTVTVNRMPEMPGRSTYARLQGLATVSWLQDPGNAKGWKVYMPSLLKNPADLLTTFQFLLSAESK